MVDEAPEAPVEPEASEAPEAESPVKKAPKKKKQKEEKTVGEMLKEEGVIAKTEEEGKIKFEEEIDIKDTVMKIEKLDAQVSALKDIKFQADERIKELAESVGELRSLLFQRDAEIKETITKVDKLEEITTEVKPEKITKELHSKEEELEKNRANIERTDKMLHEVSKKVDDIQAILDNIKSMENLVQVSKEIDGKIAKIEELITSAKRDTGKVEKFYLDMDRKLSQLSRFEERLNKVDDLTKELVESNDKFYLQLKSLVSKDDLEIMLRDMLHVPESSTDVGELENQKKEIESLMKNLEEQYKNGIISEGSYDEVVKKNEKLVKQLEDKIKKAGIKERPKDVQAWMNNIDEAMKNVELKQSLQEERLSRSETSFGVTADVKTKIEEDLENMRKEISNLRGSTSAPATAKAVVHEAELEADEIKSFLFSLEDEYRRGLISEDTYSEVRQRNLEKLKSLGKDEHLPEKKISAVEPAKPELSITDELSQIKSKVMSLKEKKIDTSELEELIKLAEKKIVSGYSSIAKIYLDSIKEKMMAYGRG